jgi:hypothetical protein
MRTINQSDPHRQLPTRAAGGIERDEPPAAPRARQRLVAEAVIASYIHEISVRHSGAGRQLEFGVRT